MGLYVDGVYVARSVGAILDIVDVERVEVLRGPRGALFGRNAIGGAISVVARQPEIGGEMAGSMSASVGSDSLMHLVGSVEGTLSDTAAARLSVASLNQDGYVQRTDGIDLGDDDTLTARPAVNWQPATRCPARSAWT